MQTLYQRHQQTLSRIRTGSQYDDLIRHFRASNRHKVEDYQMFGIEKIFKCDAYRKVREKFWIGKLGTLKPRGLNTKSCWYHCTSCYMRDLQCFSNFFDMAHILLNHPFAYGMKVCQTFLWPPWRNLLMPDLAWNSPTIWCRIWYRFLIWIVWR